ncbi:AAA family ATPase [Mesoplasma corruscae]|uniref:Chromosome partition protein Smc n=1 Tax=Mesoplasma corruscae TaxID=216874 RepID=A0A2S5RGM1_9MOLU|nr:AAA family ATPase [Mesoplasma corruscae]PPE06441.1 chromosome condensation and segregation SMC ATPase [Mesoplasma corruscae]
MLFLKQIRATGFKSFADTTILNFTKEMIGVVGPNGSGKSNITDSIRWALGEQSNKSLRGSNMDDIVFSGSVGRPAAEYAEVTLVFDNQRDIFSTLSTDIVEITRKFSKKNRESEFYINGVKCKLRDIQDIALETGLTKSSIAIISQGTISRFAEAKPDVRREIFDEAAGVAKYKKRKLETQRKLEKASDNLLRIKDISDEIGRRLPTLKKKAEKAEKYKHLAEELQNIELAVLAKDALTYEVELEKLRTAKRSLEIKTEKLANEINLSQDELDVMLSKSSSTDIEINELNSSFQKIVERVASLKTQKQKVDSKESEKHSEANIDEIKAINLKKEYDEKTISLHSEKDLVASFEAQEKEAKREYDQISDSFERIHLKRQEIESEKNRLQFKLDDINQRARTSSISASSGAKNIIENKNRLSGVVGTVESLISVKEEYHVAFSLITGNHLQSVVFKTDEDAKKAIEFLKRNNFGRVNALPVSTLNPSSIAEAQKQVIKKAPGFIGFANELIEIKENCQVVLDYIYGTAIVTKTFDDAVRLGRSINYRYGIVSLDGQRVMPRGAMSGGSVSKATNIFAARRVDESINPETIAKNIQTLNNLYEDYQKEFNALRESREKSSVKIQEIMSNIKVSKFSITSLESNLEVLSENYKILTGKELYGDKNVSFSNESESIRISREIAKLESQRNEISVKLNILSNSRTQNSDRQHEINKDNKEKRNTLNEWKDTLASVKSDLNMMENTNIMILQKLSEKYNLNLDAVRQMSFDVIENVEQTRARILELSMELKEIGDVSIDSIEEYKGEQERFDYYDVQLKDIQEAIEKLESIIADIDIEMKTQFKKIVDDVNAALPEAFKKLFNGGTATLIYTDPDNILETGIDIDVQPPGKIIQNINLLSGGEKSLVALSVLFSILKVRPLPLVILDEVEAPLDVANVTRFAKYVREFVDVTQFIIVTHREGTMENCDILFGVTMQTKGITKIVNLDLKWDVIKKLLKN